MSKYHPAYVAGILDGEGCFNIHKNTNKTSYTARLMVGMVDGTIPHQLCETYGGSLQHVKSRSANSRDSWMWYATGIALDRVIHDVLPYLVVKREQAMLCLKLRNQCKAKMHIVKGRKGTQHLSPEILAEREAMKQRVNALNRVGKVA